MGLNRGFLGIHIRLLDHSELDRQLSDAILSSVNESRCRKHPDAEKNKTRKLSVGSSTAQAEKDLRQDLIGQYDFTIL